MKPNPVKILKILVVACGGGGVEEEEDEEGLQPGVCPAIVTPLWAALIEGRPGNVAFNENITVMASRIQIVRKDTVRNTR